MTAIPLPTLSGDERPVPSFPQPSPPDQPDAGEEVILGIDTHKDVHAAVVISLLGVVLGRRCFSTTASGYESLLDWARGFGALRRAGVEVLTFASAKPYQSIALSSAELKDGVTYDVYHGGSSTGTVEDGLYQDGTYSGGTHLGSFTVSGMVTRLGSTRYR